MISIKKYIILTSIVLILSLICISSVSAANFDDDASSENLLKTNEETTITDNGKNDISLNGKQTESYGNKVTGPNVNNAANDMSFRELYEAIEKAGTAGNNYTLNGNVTQAESGDIKEGIVVRYNNMVIDGAGYTIDAKGMARIFDITGKNVVLKNFKFINAKGDLGGAIKSNDVIQIIDCEFINCHATTTAGAIYLTGNNCNISHCNFTNCSSDMEVGTVYVGRINTNIESCIFENNYANDKGGALYVQTNANGTVVRNCTFNNNSDFLNYGAAIYWNANDGIIDNCTFIGNIVNENGGAIYINLGTGNNITNSRFEDNKAKRGAGILTNGENTTIENCTFLNIL